MEYHSDKSNRWFDILRWIDEAILDNSIGIENFFSGLRFKLKQAFGTQRIGIYSVSEHVLVPFKFRNGQEKRIDTPTILGDFQLPREVKEGRVIVADCAQVIGESYTTLFIPIYFSGSLILMVLQDSELSSHLKDDIISFAKDTAKRIGLLIRYKENERLARVTADLTRACFEYRVNPARYWEKILGHIVLFLPDWFPFRIDDAPLVQILTYQEGDKHMLLRATQGTFAPSRETKCEQRSISLKVEETICGLAIEQNKDVLLVNPQKEFSRRYQSYSFGTDIPKSELVVAIRHESKIIALLNLEHRDEDIFNAYHISLLQKAAGLLGIFLEAVCIQGELQNNREISLIYTMTNLLQRTASVYRHKVANLLLKTRLTIAQIEKLQDGAKGKTHEFLSQLRELINEFQEMSNSFLEHLPDYTHYGRVNICQIISDAIKEFNPEALEEKERIYIDFHSLSGETAVYASQMLVEHIYNLINNSIEAIRESIGEGRTKTGKIAITVRREEIEDAQKEKVSPLRIYVRIDDNGGGVSEKAYSRIGEFGYTTKGRKGGTGYGLAAAKEYVQSVGGDLRIENFPGKGFSVVLCLQEFDPSYHLEEREL